MPEKSVRYVSQRELDCDFLCHTSGCEFNGPQYVARWIRVHYDSNDRDEFRNVIVRLVAEQLQEKVAETDDSEMTLVESEKP